MTLIGLKDDSLVAVQRIAEEDVDEEKSEEAQEAAKAPASSEADSVQSL